MIDEGLWAELENMSVTSPGLARRRVREDSARDLFVGVSLPRGNRVFVLRVQADTKIPDMTPTKALSVHMESVALDTVEIRVLLEVSEMRGVFTPFVIDVVNAVAETQSDADAVRMLADRFDHWRTLFAGDVNGLGEVAQRGLLGELWVARSLLSPSIGPDSAVLAWTGPDRDRRDFLIDGLGIEVKTTTSAPPASILVQNELQLDDSPLDRLVLVAIELDRASGAGGLSLNDLVGWARDCVDAAAGVLEAKLRTCGYHDVHAARYDDYRFVLRAVHVYEVRGAFPRVVPSDLPAGVGDVEYRVSLGACEPWKIEVDQLAEVLQGISTGAEQ